MNKIAIRLLIPFLIVILTVLAFKNGVSVADKPELHMQPVGILLFHAINLFTLGAKDLGQPIAGPYGWQMILYSMYYLAPLISITALAEIIYVLSKPFLPLLLYKGRHFIIIGSGRVGKAAYEALRQEYGRHIQVVFVDKNVNETGGGFNVLHWRKLYINRDITDVKSLDELRLNSCRGAFILTDNEWLNMKAYYHLKKQMNEDNQTPIFTRLSSADVIRFMQADGQVPSWHRFFNIHIAASGQLFDSHFINEDVKEGYNRFHNWHNDEIITWLFFGFGRFASTFLSEVLRDDVFLKTVQKIVIIDMNAGQAWQNFIHDHPAHVGFNPILINSSMENIGLLKEQMADYANPHSIAVFGSNDETRNIKCAASFHKMYDKRNELKYIIRTRYKDSFPAELMQNVIGQEVILVPTYHWIKAYFEDEFRSVSSTNN
jgi:hypothetical protein